MEWINENNYNLHGETGENLKEVLIHIVDKKIWEESITYFFHDSAQTNIIWKNYCFYIKPNPQSIQVRSGILDFHKKPSRWIDLKKFVIDSGFPKFWKNFLTEKINGKNFTDQKIIACVLLCFEIARRVFPKENYPITRKMTRDAIDEVMEASTETYTKKVDKKNKMNSPICYKHFKNFLQFSIGELKRLFIK